MKSIYFQRVLFVILLLYFLIGAFPFAYIESDSVAIVNGVNQMISEGLGPNYLTYRYSAQPGTYCLILFVTKISGLSPYIVFSILTILFGLGFILLTCKIISKYVSLNFYQVFFILVLIQEFFSELYYPSSTVIASFPLILSFYLFNKTQNKYNIYAAILFAIAIWMRFDVILIIPFMLIFLLKQKNKTYVHKLITVCSSFFLLVALILLSKADVFAMVNATKTHMGMEYSGTTGFLTNLLSRVDLINQLSIFSITCMILCLGGFITCLYHRKATVGLVLIALLPIYIIFHDKITTPKYLYYYLPVFLLLSAIFVDYLVKKRKKIVLILIALTMMQYVLGIQIELQSKPHHFMPKPIILKLFQTSNIASDLSKIDLVLGTGEIFMTADYYRLSSGIFFSPIFWNLEKSRLNDEFKKTILYVDKRNFEDLVIITTRYSSFQRMCLLLTDIGYQINKYNVSETENEQTIFMRRDKEEITLVENYYPDHYFKNRDIQPLQKILQRNMVDNSVFFTSALWERYLFETNFHKYKKISEYAFILKNPIE